MSSSELTKSNYIEAIEDKIFIDSYFTSRMIKSINEFYESLPNIIQDRKNFLVHLLQFFYENFPDKNQFEYYLEFILKVVNLTKKNLEKIKSHLLNTTEAIKITEIQCNSLRKGTVITFSNNAKVVFESNQLGNEKIFNRIICWFNSKADKECRLYIKGLISCDTYSFTDYIQSLECANNKEFDKYYFHSGQLLALLYILNCINFKSNSIVTHSQYPVLKDLDELFITFKNNLTHNLSSRNIAQDIIDCSVYNIDFLPNSKKPSSKFYMDSIKSGFDYMYSIIVNNKLEFIALLQNLFCRNSSYLSYILAKIYGLNEGDLKRQLNFLDVRFIRKQTPKTLITFSSDNRPNQIKREFLLKLAINLGDHIIQKSIIGFDHLTTSRTWINTVKCGNDMKLSPRCYDLHDGNSGIALFLIYLGTVTKKDYFITSGVESMRESISYLNNLNNLNIENLVKTGAFRGIAGELYTLSKIYSITKDKTVKEVIEKSILFLQLQINKDMNINILEGTAGIIEVLLSIYENKEFSDINDKVLATANLAYKNLANHKDFVNSISGFGYGNDGVIAALARLLAITGNKEIEGTLRELLNVERNINPMKKIYSPSGWHKGYPGILLSKLILKKSNYKDSLIDIEISEALEQTIKNGFGNSPYYYNGDIGNLQILEYAAEVLNDTSLKNRCTNTFNKLVEKVIEPSIKDEINFHNKSISFMTGIVGQGYSLIKKCGGDLVPQILWLQ